ncbi:MAG: DUF4321 domain-containing protein [Clostridium sp.]|uniref:DUF4321 domain-containing protein n=1 Tax=Clostridium sp. TaxID=1506 RepID=UPI00302765CE
MGKVYKSAKEYVFIILLGAISGSFIGEFLGNTFNGLEILGKTYFIGLKNPLVIDLKVLELTFGLGFGLNLMAIIGIVLAIVLYKKF